MSPLWWHICVQGPSCSASPAGWPFPSCATVLAMASVMPCCPSWHISHKVGECCWLHQPSQTFYLFQRGGKTMPLERWSMLYKSSYHGNFTMVAILSCVYNHIMYHDSCTGWFQNPPVGFCNKVGWMRPSVLYAMLPKRTKFLLPRSYSLGSAWSSRY